MKILLTTHGYPPHATGGTEGYAAELARALAGRGHEVHVLTARKDISRQDCSLSERQDGPVRVHELVNNLYHRDFRQTWDNPRVESRFEDLLERLQPDLLHVQHLLYLSLSCVAAAHGRRIPVVMTLHDYWLQCPRLGQRVRTDGGLCHEIDHARCGVCLSGWKWRQRPGERRLGRLIAAVRRATGLDLGPLARGTAARLARPPAAGVAQSRRAVRGGEHAAAELEGEARLRARYISERIAPCVWRFLAPSRFLRQRFVEELHLPPSQVEHLPFGIDPGAFRPQARVPSVDGRLRVAFLGALVPVKGPHLLLEAWGALPAGLRARGELALFGAALHDPAYQARLAGLARAAGARIGARLSREQVAAQLARTDLLVVPSLWFENSPLVIHEARATGTPLLVADLGGMAELVEDGVHGFHFKLGDAADLTRQLAAALSGQLPLTSLYPQPVAMPRLEDHVAALEQRYAAALAQVRGA